MNHATRIRSINMWRPRGRLRLWVGQSQAVGHAHDTQSSSPLRRSLYNKGEAIKDELMHARHVDPDGVHFLRETRLPSPPRLRRPSDVATKAAPVTLWDRIQTYRRDGYAEKTVLIAPSTGESIARAIRQHSERGPDTIFLDADGGFCYVTKELIRHNAFSRVKVCLKDTNLKALHDHAFDHFPNPHRVDVSFHDLNLCQQVADYLGNKANYVSPLYEMTCPLTDGARSAMSKSTELADALNSPSAEWSQPHPPYTLFGTVTHALVKYLTINCLYREKLGSEFSIGGRPEFFFIMAPRTWLHLSQSPGTQDKPIRILRKNMLFQLLFDFEAVAELPRQAFFPWKAYKKPKLSCMMDSYHRHKDSMYLVKARPKVDLGLHENVTPDHVYHFVSCIYRKKFQRFIPLAEKWLPGIGRDYIRQAGIGVYAEVGDIPLEQVLPLLNILASHENFLHSNFALQAQSANKSISSGPLGSDEAQNLLLKMRREHGMDDD